MLKLCDKIYVGRCLECEPVLGKGYTLIYACHWPCTRLQTGAGGPSRCRARELFLTSRLSQKVHFIDLQNVEIPNYKTEDFNTYLDIIDRAIENGEAFLISEKGESRAASLGLLWMAKRGKLISRSSFTAARADFARLYPEYRPWPGWVIFYQQEWDALK